MKRTLSLGLAVGAFALLAASQSVSAASLVICDSAACGSSDPNITFSMNDFEGGFQINGTTRQQGLSSPATFSFSERTGPQTINGAGENDFSGVWQLGRPITQQSETIWFLEGDGTVSDVLHYSYSQDTNGNGHIDGAVISDYLEQGLSADDLIAAGFSPTQQLRETGLAFLFNNTNITASFQSDPSEVPLPPALPLFASGLGMLGLFRWRKKRNSTDAITAA